jgi:hypothetical protein
MRDNKHYEVYQSTAREGAVVCFSLDRARPDSYMAALEDELQRAAYHGVVLLDLFATNGNNHRRFMRLTFDGDRLHWLQAKTAKLDSIPVDLLDFCNDFYLSHPAVVENSVLSRDAQLKFLGDHALA